MKKLAAYLAPIFDDTCSSAERLAIAVSGGADSMALALLAQQWCSSRQIHLTALTVDHGLRPESADEARQVQQWMQQHGIAHHILAPAAPPINNTQNRAREMRFAALSEWCSERGITHLLLAHHADDQAETVALQQHRGDNGPSQCGMALVRAHGDMAIVRPLLGVRKQHLIAHLETIGQHWIEDPSNRLGQYARNRLRQTMTDEAMQSLWHRAQLAGQTRHHDEAQQQQWFAEHASLDGEGVRFDLTAWRHAQDQLRTNVLSYAIRSIGGKQHRPRYQETLHLDSRLRTEPHGAATLGHCAVRWKENLLTILPEHPLAAKPGTPYMGRIDRLKALGNMPFWCFNYPPFNDGAARAPA